MNIKLTDLRQRIAACGMSQNRLAGFLGYETTMFSRVLNGVRSTPEGFDDRLLYALDRLVPMQREIEAARAELRAELMQREIEAARAELRR